MGSINKSHNETDGGILLFQGELILLYCDSVQCEVGGKESMKGRVYLTTHRLVVIVTPYRQNATVKSLCAPFCAIIKCSVEQPIFGANYIEATVRDETDPTKSFSFKLKFSKGGAIELAMAMNRAVAAVGRNFNPSVPPPPAYTPSPSSQYYQAPPTVYAPGYNCGVQMPTQQFPDQPPIGFIYASSAPPPYPGLNNPTQAPAGGATQPPPYGAPTQNPSGGYPTQGGGYPQQPPPAAGGYPPQTGGYPQQVPPAGYPQAPGPQSGYPPQQQPISGYPQQPAAPTGYPGGQPSGYPQPQQPGSGQPGAPSGSGYPTLNQPGNSGSTGAQESWPSAPSFNPNWQDEKKQS